MKKQTPEGYTAYSLDATVQDGKFKEVRSVVHIGGTEERPQIEERQLPDGTIQKELRFRAPIMTFRDALLHELQAIAGSVDISEDLRQKYLQRIRDIRENIESISPRAPDKGGQVNIAIVPLKAVEDEARQQAFEQLTGILFNTEVHPVMERLILQTPLYSKPARKGTAKKTKAAAEAPGNIKMSIALAQQHFRTPATERQQKLKPTEEIATKWQGYTGIEALPVSQDYGLDLTERQRKSLNVVLQAFTKTQYKGNTEQLYLEDVLPKFKEQPEEVLKNVAALQTTNGQIIKALPQIRLTQAEYLRLCGIPEDRRSERQEAIEALQMLGMKQHCFWWQRPKKQAVKLQTKDGRHLKTEYRVQRDPHGKAQVEDVYTVETVLKVKEIRSPQTNELEYYEIAPSYVAAQCLGGGEYLIYPHELERAIVEKTGKRLKKYEALLLLWLTMKFTEEVGHRQILKKHGNEAALQKAGGTVPTEIVIDYEQLCLELGMKPETLKKKRRAAHAQLQKAFEIAKRAGFLKDYERLGTGEDRLIFEPEAYSGAKKNS